jgi:hypothetical protein
MTLQASPLDTPDDRASHASSYCDSQSVFGSAVPPREPRLRGVHSRTDSVPATQRQKWLRWVEAITTVPGQRPVLTLVMMVPTIAALLLFINKLAPQAMPEVCSTLVLAVVAEFVLVVRRKRSLIATTG